MWFRCRIADGICPTFGLVSKSWLVAMRTRCVWVLLATLWCSIGFTGGAPRRLQGALRAGKDDKPLSYYAGMVTNPVNEADSEKDMITPTLKFVGYGAIFGLAYLALFIGLNSGSAP